MQVKNQDLKVWLRSFCQKVDELELDPKLLDSKSVVLNLQVVRYAGQRTLFTEVTYQMS